MNYVMALDSSDFQLVMMALAHLGVERPGWHPEATSRIAREANGEELYEGFRRLRLSGRGRA